MGARRSMAAQPAAPLLIRLFNKRIWFVGLASVAVYVAITGTGVLFDQVLPIRSIEVTGQFQGLKIASLEKAVAGYVSAGFFGADVNAIKHAAEQLPWASSVSVRRVWPDRIQLEVTEQQAIARWGDDTVINDAGELFHPGPDNLPADLAQLRGPEGTHTLLLSHFMGLQPVLAARGLAVTSLAYNRRRAIEIGLNNGVRLLIGRVRDVQESIALINRFAIAWDYALVNRAENISSVDLRYTNGFSVQWKDGDIAGADRKVNRQNVIVGNAARGSVNG